MQEEGPNNRAEERADSRSRDGTGSMHVVRMAISMPEGRQRQHARR